MSITHKLMIKTHNETGLKYLCYTTAFGKEYDEYLGSGKYWLRHLEKHGNNISTTLIFETDSYDKFKILAREKSIELNIVDSPAWANLRIEDGQGGNTTSIRMWITDGKNDQYIFKKEIIPSGWMRGRSKCVFNDKNSQRKFSHKSDPKKRGKSIKLAWDSGKFEKRKSAGL